MEQYTEARMKALEEKNEKRIKDMIKNAEKISKDEEKETGIKESDKLIVAITPGNFTEIKQKTFYCHAVSHMKCNLVNHSSQKFRSEVSTIIPR